MAKIHSQKKGDINWIVVGMIIALIAMAVVLYIFRSQMKSASEGFGFAACCENQKGRSVADSKSCSADEIVTNLKPCDTKSKNKYCCISQK